MHIERAIISFGGEKSGSNPVLGRFGVGFRTPFCAHPAHAWRMMPLFGHFWSKCQSFERLGGRKHPPGHRPGEGGYAKITKIAGFRGSPSQGTRRHFSLENCFKPSQMLKIFSLRGPHQGPAGPPAPDPGPLSERTPPSAWRGRCRPGARQQRTRRHSRSRPCLSEVAELKYHWHPPLAWQQHI